MTAPVTDLARSRDIRLPASDARWEEGPREVSAMLDDAGVKSTGLGDSLLAERRVPMPPNAHASGKRRRR
jgi:hypothetical protein